MDKKLDCMGMACPLPVVNAKKAMEAFEEEGILTVCVDNDTAVQNLTRLAKRYDYAVSSEKKSEQEYEVRIEVKPGKKSDEGEKGRCVTSVVIASECMGNGDDTLGRNLIKSFLFALTNVDPLPDYILFYNSGVLLAAEGSPALEDLKNLEKAGVKIMSCGICAGNFNVKEKIAVGIISNMYDIVDTQMHSDRILRP